MRAFVEATHNRVPASGRLAFVALLVFSALFAVAYLPFIMTEVSRDWTTFARSAQDLKQGVDLYFDRGVLINLYPPSMAVLWSLGVTPQLWLAASVIALGGVSFLGRAWGSLGLYALTVIQLPVLYDLLTGNVTSFYVGAIAIRLASKRAIAGVPLGIILAIAPKPAIVPFVLVLLVKQPRRAVVPIAVAIGVTAAVAAMVGTDPYVEYVAALLDSQRQLAGWVGGNVGLARIGPSAVLGGILVAVSAVAIALRYFSWERAVVAGIAVGPLVQPTLGFYYAALAIPGVILLWKRTPWTSVIVGLVAIASAVITPVISGVVLAAGAFASHWLTLRDSGEARSTRVVTTQ